MSSLTAASRRSPVLPSVLLLALLSPTLAAAQALPNAGQLLQQMTPPPHAPATAPARTTVDAPAPAAAASGERIHVKGFRVSGATAFPTADLEALLQDGVGRDLTVAELEALAGRITARYREAGYLVAMGWLPPQDIREGIVDIAVQEGRLGQVKVDNRAGIAPSALAPLYSRVSPGDVVHNDNLEASLLALSDLPGVEVRSTLRPGATVGTTDFLVDVLPAAAITGSADFDNFGNRYTGANRLGGTVNWNNAAGLGDQASLRAQVSDGRFSYARVGYQLPVGADATRVGVAWSDMRYRLGENFTSLNADGKASVASLYVQHPFVRSRERNWTAQVQYDDKRLNDRVGSTATNTDKALSNWTLGVNGSFSDGLFGGWLGNAGNSLSLSWITGDLGLDAATAAIDSATAQSAGRFAKWSLSYQRNQRLADEWMLSLSASGQWANKNLDSSEKFTLGGAYGVRAYPQGEASGDDGQLFTLELRHPLFAGWEATAFFDAGRVTINRNPWTTATANTRHLAGYGFGAAYAGNRYALRILAAWKAGSSLPTSDADRAPRIWAQGAFYF